MSSADLTEAEDRAWRWRVRGVLFFLELSRNTGLILWSIWVLRLPVPLVDLRFWKSLAVALKPLGSPEAVIGITGISIGGWEALSVILLLTTYDAGLRRVIRISIRAGAIAAVAFWVVVSVGFAHSTLGLMGPPIVSYGLLAWLNLPTAMGLPGPRRS